VVGLNAIALAEADEHVLGAVIKFGCSAIAYPSKTDEIADFRFSRKLIAFSLHLARVKAIASPSCFEATSLRLGFITRQIRILRPFQVFKARS
jgi:hypothetical protein